MKTLWISKLFFHGRTLQQLSVISYYLSETAPQPRARQENGKPASIIGLHALKTEENVTAINQITQEVIQFVKYHGVLLLRYGRLKGPVPD